VSYQIHGSEAFGLYLPPVSMSLYCAIVALVVRAHMFFKGCYTSQLALSVDTVIPRGAGSDATASTNTLCSGPSQRVRWIVNHEQKTRQCIYGRLRRLSDSVVCSTIELDNEIFAPITYATTEAALTTHMNKCVEGICCEIVPHQC
jgi:hypothetical protein